MVKYPILLATLAVCSAAHGEQPSSDHAKSYLDLLSPENLPSSVLAIVGIVGIIVALRTLKKISVQTEIMAGQANSMKRQVTHMRRQTLIAIRSSRTSQKAAEFARQSVRSAERADVLLESLNFESPIAPKLDYGGSLILTFKNFGRTRADDAIFRGDLFVDAQVPIKSSPIPPLVLGAGQTQPMRFRPLRDFVSLETFRGIESGKVQLRFKATVVYVDVFGASLTTWYGGVFNARTLGFDIDQHVAG